MDTNGSSEKLVLVVNPGSASRKYALFRGQTAVGNLHYEFEQDKIVCTISYQGERQQKSLDGTDLSTVAEQIEPFLRESGMLPESEQIAAIGVRVVAPSDDFAQDRLIDDQVITLLTEVKNRAPLHVTVVLEEIRQLRKVFPQTPFLAVSDSKFHNSKPDYAATYGFDLALAKKLHVKRYGYHGISVESVVRRLRLLGKLPRKLIVCHLGSGGSITAVIDGSSADNTMGYTPLEGITMASRTGSIDVSAALAVKRELQLSDDELEIYLNKKSGLLGVSASSDDIRQLLEKEDAGDGAARLALSIYVYRVQLAIGQMAASMNGVDGIVFTATVGERSSIMRQRIMQGLTYLGFVIDGAMNSQTTNLSRGLGNIATADSKPILVVPTDEAAEIVRHVHLSAL